MTATFLFCSDPLNPRRVDDHFAAQAEAVRTAGGNIALLDHDALIAGEPGAAVRRVPRSAGTVWYRGWMIPVDRYHDLAQVLSGRDCVLATAPECYAKAHELPGWYEPFAGLTPRSVWTATKPGEVPGESVLAELAGSLRAGPGIVKDYVKSRKHEWDTACYVSDLRDTAALKRIVEWFVELQEEFLTGGVVLREFEDFTDDADGRAAEARVWWLDGEPVLVGPHPDDPAVCPEPDLSAVGQAVSALGCRFVTTDVARRADGSWRVIEVGDGQVSDLPSGVDPMTLIGPLVGR
ncbi:ATP-grasp domain-containing protein [Nocardia asteroides]|uniref:ATP-grasp domain-containing protein n=1 Tax=Nocardia asteroides TaxID=1824 RepID=UPI001E2B8C05|nr:ATP-grasp domain-containing protein [Nocardia asteroides]UGT54427.1 ATP-grasp domain-containing protein [Nocardia asteroides]